MVSKNIFSIKLYNNFLEKLEDTKGVIRSCKWKDRQYNGQNIWAKNNE